MASAGKQKKQNKNAKGIIEKGHNIRFETKIASITKYLCTNIKLVLFTHKGSYFLTENKKLPINDQLNKTILYLSQINRIINNLLFVGPHLEPNIEINRKTILKNYNNNLSDKINYDLIIVDKKLKELSKKNNINYLSKIETLKFDFEKDFIVEGNFTFSDTDHWNDFGEMLV